jgi:hypothetical protein
MTATTRHHPKHSGGRRRGSIYAVVLALAVLVSLIGLSAVAVGRINLRSAANSTDATAAELLAVSAVEHGVAVLNSQANWRGNTLYFNEQTTSPIPLGAGQIRWKLRDELDGDIRLSAGGIQPVRLFGIGEVGDARRVYSVVLVPTGANLLANPDMEAGVSPYEPESGNCALAVTGTAVRNGVRCLAVTSRTDRTGGPRQDVTSKITSGKSYYTEAWLKMAAAPEQARITLVVTGSGGLLGLSPWKQTFTATSTDNVGLDWTKVGLALNPSFDGTVDRIYWRIETASTAQNFWVDDVKLIESTTTGAPTPMAPARESWRQEEYN